MTTIESDVTCMTEALELARRGSGYVEPNPMVGAVVVKGDRVVGRGWHRRFGGPHAEVFALEEAGEAARGATMYVTLEPCAHHGKTPPCAPAVAGAGISRVVIAAHDPTPESGGWGMAHLRDAGIRVECGVCREEALLLNAPFYKFHRTGLPLVIAKWAMSADGKIATRGLESRWISCPESREVVHSLRGRVDAVVVGARTARRDDPLLTCRRAEKRRTATRVVMCGSIAPEVPSRLVQTASDVPVLLAHAEGNCPDGLSEAVEAGCRALPLRPYGPEDRCVDPGALLEALAARDAVNVLVEGGGAVLGSFFDRGLVDRVMAFVGPVVVGGSDAVSAVAGSGVEAMEDAPQLRRVEIETPGRDVLLTGWVSDPLEWAPE